MVKARINGQSGNPIIIDDRIAGTPEVIPVKFDNTDDAQSFIKKFDKKKDFASYLDGFWCNFSQTKAERDSFKEYMQPLFKINRAILEWCPEFDVSRIVISLYD